jgi:thiamine biosynthesis lipoprotein
MKRFSIRLLQMSLFILTFASCKQEYFSESGIVYGTTYHFVHDGDSEKEQEVVKVMRDVELIFSPFDSASVVSKINRGDTVRIDQRFAYLFDLAQRVNQLSDGAFDPTVAPLVNLWGFGYNNAEAAIPTQADIDSALMRVGIADCRINADSTLQLKHPRTELDFSAIAKGYAVDCVARALEQSGAENYMVEIGGEMAIKGHNPRGTEWRVQIDAPISDSAGVEHTRMRVVGVSEGALATSGNYRNFRQVEGRRFGHTINPKTGQPEQTATLSATIYAPTCAEADALATACMVMPHQKALKMIESLDGIEALIVIAHGDSYKIITTPGFPR